MFHNIKNYQYLASLHNSSTNAKCLINVYKQMLMH